MYTCISIYKHIRVYYYKYLKTGYSSFCASVLLIKIDLKLVKSRMFCIILNINSSSYAFRTITNQNNAKYSYGSSYFTKYSDSKCKQSICLLYGLYPTFNVLNCINLLFTKVLSMFRRWKEAKVQGQQCLTLNCF